MYELIPFVTKIYVVTYKFQQ